MRAVVQRVLRAAVYDRTDNDRLVSEIGPGLCVLVGIHRHDTVKQVEWMVQKILKLRLFTDVDDKPWMISVRDKNYQVLLVSQFTLNAVFKGNKPDYHNSMDAVDSQPMYELMLNMMRKEYCKSTNASVDEEMAAGLHAKIQPGAFQHYMRLEITNDGPVTMVLDAESAAQDKVSSNDADRGKTTTVVPGDAEK